MSVSDQKILSSPFPGMDPYLEGSPYWRGFHQHLAVEIVRSLNPRITPKYFANIELHSASQELIISETPPRLQSDTHHIYPDVTITQSNSPSPGLAIQTAVSTINAPIERVVELPKPETLRSVRIYLADNRELVAAIELLSPANKVGRDRAEYQRKRARIIQSGVHLIEIDLLRGGSVQVQRSTHLPLIPIMLFSLTVITIISIAYPKFGRLPSTSHYQRSLYH